MTSYISNLFYNKPETETSTVDTVPDPTENDIDTATSKGQIERVYEMFRKYKLQPSLEAKHHAIDSGHPDMAILIDTFIGTRGFMISVVDIDIATEKGKINEVQELHMTYKLKPSLYAKQMALVNGHIDTYKYVDKFIGTRGNIGIATVHKTRDSKTGKLEWSEVIPKAFQFELGVNPHVQAQTRGLAPPDHSK